MNPIPSPKTWNELLRRANAYPQLVKALQELLTGGHYDPNINWVQTTSMTSEKARGLLRELGEDYMRSAWRDDLPIGNESQRPVGNP